jgi:Flp pilus assembly protein TadB
MGVPISLLSIAGSIGYTLQRKRRQEKLEKKRTNEAIAKMEREKEAEKQEEKQRQIKFFESTRKRNLARQKRTQRTFAGMSQDFNPALMKQKLGQ